VALIDDLLARTHLLDDPVQPQDVISYEETDPASFGAQLALPSDRSEAAAAQDLTVLCESVLAHTGAESLQKEFDTDQLPAAPGARILGCILHIADDVDGARMWWQYAAGADDNIAAFCLYLHHLSLGELHVADRWREWTKVDTLPSLTPLTPCTDPPPSVTTVDVSTPTVLRTLRHLVEPGQNHKRPRSEFATAVLDFVPNAVAAGYITNPDTAMPVPAPHFADRIGTIIAVTASDDGPPSPRRRSARLPARGASPRLDPNRDWRQGL
jgi:hypothetical protein